MAKREIRLGDTFITPFDEEEFTIVSFEDGSFLVASPTVIPSARVEFSLIETKELDGMISELSAYRAHEPGHCR